MKKFLVNKSKMIQGTNEYCDKHPDIIKKIPTGEKSLANMKIGYNQVMTNSAILEQTNSSGITKQKNGKREILVDSTLLYANKLHSFAKHKRDPVLINNTKLTKRELQVASEIKLLNIAEGISGLIDENLAELVLYKLNADTQKAFREDIDGFKNSLPSRSEYSTTVNAYNDLIQAGFDMCDEAIDDMDEGVKVIVDEEPEFYNGYWVVRRIPQFGRGSLQAQGSVKDENGNAIPGVKLHFYKPDELDEALLMKKSAAGGGFNIYSMDEGYYVVKAEKVGYEDLEVEITVVFEKLCRIDIVMKKVSKK